ncbi:peptide chain release factor 1 [Candidatus Omnitrophus magneticus]|uniref:Peptide chain release factor 1 n=1 Tax=Candidatus Omnitrophus magneticus TaxID=1609969 RepID=A0A0F0CML7_9BACT|nr:peptide chain release factor 1 [Candidatus Omnitrophus magneticus]
MFTAILNKKRELFKSIEEELSSSSILSDQKLYSQKAKEYSELKGLLEEYDKYLQLDKEKKYLESVLNEEGESVEYIELAKMELEELVKAIVIQRKRLEDLVFDDKNPLYSKNVIMEIRAGTGGEEAALFAGDLYNMYTKYSANRGWKTTVLDSHHTELGGIKEIIFAIEGKEVFKYFRFEMGTHRVQRVPDTEAGGRVHTSAATVAVLPEPEDISEIDINPQDLRIDSYRSSGAGGQHVNVTDSAIRITHIPTGLVVTCQDERSQHKNKLKAMRVLQARLLQKKQEEQEQNISAARKKQIGTGDRSEKIRTYNFQENRVTDHRIKFSLYNLPQVLEGSMEELLYALIEEERQLRIAEAQ